MNKTRQWAMLTAVGCLAVLVAGWFLAVKPQRSEAASLRTQAQAVDAHTNSLASQVAQLRQQAKDLPAQQRVLSQIATKIPDNPALPSLIRELSAAADGAGVDLVSLAPSAPTMTVPALAPGTASTTVSSAPSSAGVTTGRGSLAAIPLTLQVQGTYFNLEQFFSAVETLNRAMLVSGFSIGSGASVTSVAPTAPGGGAAAGAAAAPATLTAQLTATVFESPQTTTATAATRPATTTTGH